MRGPALNRLIPLGKRDRVLAALLELAMVAEDFFESAGDELAQAADDHHVETPTRFQPAVDVMKEQVVVLFAGLGREVGHGQRESLIRDVAQPVAEHRRGVVDLVAPCVGVGKQSGNACQNGIRKLDPYHTSSLW